MLTLITLLIVTLAVQDIRGVPLGKGNSLLRGNDNLTSMAIRQRLDELLLKIEMNNMAIRSWKEQDAEQNRIILTKLNQLVDQVNLGAF